MKRAGFVVPTTESFFFFGGGEITSYLLKGTPLVKALKLNSVLDSVLSCTIVILFVQVFGLG